MYCRYRLPHAGAHRTEDRRHGRDVRFGDTHVVLAGLLDRDQLRELLHGPPVEIELHHGGGEEPPGSAPGHTYYPGPAPDVGPAHSLIYHPGSAHRPAPNRGPAHHQGSAPSPSHNTAYSPAHRPDPGHAPSAIAHLSLSQVLGGRIRAEARLQLRGAPGGPHVDYVGADSTLKVKVEMTRPPPSEAEPRGGPFGRLVCLLRPGSSAAAGRLRAELTAINVAALRLRCGPAGGAEEALRNHGRSFALGGGAGLDFLSGFHVTDGRGHILVLEGLKDKALRRLWESPALR